MNDSIEQADAPRKSKALGTSLGIAALVLAFATLLIWNQQIRAVDIPENRALYVVVFLSAVAMGIAAFVTGTRWFGGFAAVIAIFLGSLLPFTMAISRQELAAGAIAVGDVIPAFESVDEFGEPFDSGTLHDHILLIKFFRAHW